MVNNSAIELMWDLPFPDVYPDTYTIHYSYLELSGEEPRSGETIFDCYTGSVTTYTLTNLLPYTMYNISVAAIYNNASSENVSVTNQTMEGGDFFACCMWAMIILQSSRMSEYLLSVVMAILFCTCLSLLFSFNSF